MGALVRVVAAGDTHIGLREHNEDAVLLRRELDLFALADGAGANNAGNIAANVALTTLAHRFEETADAHGEQPTFDVLGLPTAARRLSAAIHRANAEVVQLAQASDRYRGMGTTMLACYVERKRAVMHMAHVGDSRCYRLRAGLVELLTQDHSLANDVLELAPEIEEERARGLPSRVVTRALGMARTVRVTMQSVALAPGDRYLLCSDGLTDELEEEQIADALRQELRPDALVKLLLEIAHAPEAKDNIAVVTLDVHAVGAEDWPTPSLRARPARERESDDEPEIIIVERGESERPSRASSGAPATLAPDSEEQAVTGNTLDGFPLPPDDEPLTQEYAVHVVPDASGQHARELQVLLHDLPESRREGEPTLRFVRGCQHCGAKFDGPADVCPFCWKAV